MHSSTPVINRRRHLGCAGDIPRGDQQQTLADAILTELERINEGEEQKTISSWDGPVAASVRALGTTPEQRAEVGESLRRQLDIDEESEIDRSELVRYALRLGFRQVDPDKFETLKESVREHATQGL